MPQEITKTVYYYNELSEAAKENAYQHWYEEQEDEGYPYLDDVEGTIEDFEETTHCSVADWEFWIGHSSFYVDTHYWRSDELYGIYDEVIAEVIDQDDYEEEFGRDMVEYYDLTPEDKEKVNEGVKQAFIALIEAAKEKYINGNFVDVIYKTLGETSHDFTLTDENIEDIMNKTVEVFFEEMSEDFENLLSKENFEENAADYNTYYEDGSIYYL